MRSLGAGAAMVVFVLCAWSVDARRWRNAGHNGRPQPGSEASHVICALPPKSGPCYARFQMWFHNATSGECETFVYGGCNGNDNRFWSRRICERHCVTADDAMTSQGVALPDGRRAARDLGRVNLDNVEERIMTSSQDESQSESLDLESEGLMSDESSESQEGELSTWDLLNEEFDSEDSSDEDWVPDSEDDYDEDDEDEEESEEEEDGSRRGRRAHGDHREGRRNRPRHCRPVMCRMRCPFGFRRNAAGCRICACRAVCPDVRRCGNYCPNGHKVDPRTGCETCRCKEEITPPQTESEEVDIPTHCLGRPMCMMFCATGFQKGEDGCAICRCNPPQQDKEESGEVVVVDETEGATPAHCRGRPMCLMFCENGFQKGEDGCDICRCNPPRESESTEVDQLPSHCRGRIMCARFCENGFQKGQDGCPICSCNPPTPQVQSRSVGSEEVPSHCIGRPMCRMHCATGFQTGEDGCAICRCNPPVPAPSIPTHCQGRPMCRMHCATGFQTGEDGCPICKCNPPPVVEAVDETPVHCRGRPMCLMRCENGFQTGEDGCSVCRCNPPTESESTEVDALPTHCRGRPMCLMACQNGFQTGKDGCPICRCKPVETLHGSEQEEEEVIIRRRCPRLRCPRRCRRGYVRDDMGCRTCECRRRRNWAPTAGEDDSAELRSRRSLGSPPLENDSPRPCRIPQCLIACPWGSRLIKGCPTCDCLPRPGQRPPKKDDLCPPVRCLLNCPFGFKKDRNNCPTCECRETPPPQDCPLNRCLMACPLGYEKDSNGCDTCRCKTPPTQPPARCLLPSDTGPCRGSFRRYFYNSETRTCESFIFGGCRGNRNNFGSKRHCEFLCNRSLE